MTPMDKIEALLLNYDELPTAERAEVDAYLAEHPEAAPLLAEGRALRALLEEAARAGADVPDAETVAQYVAAQYMAQHPLPPDLAALGRRIEATFAEHPEVERQYSIMRDRLKTLTTGAESPRAQFQRLTGRRLGGAQHASAPPRSAPPALASRHTTDRNDRSRGWRTSVVDRHALPLLQRVSLPRLAFAATFALVLLYSGLVVAGRAGQPQNVRLADLGAVETEFAGLRLRGADGEMDPAADRYAEALEVLHDARTSTLGLFPRYESEKLNEAIGLLKQAVELGGQDSALGLEAWFLIGKILLYEGDFEPARAAFQLVVQRQGLSAPDAQRILDQLRPAPAVDGA